MSFAFYDSIHLYFSKRAILTHQLSFASSSIHQTNLVEWVAKVYYASLGEMQRQSLRKGIYNALTKHYERVVGEDEDLGKRQKRGTIRWRKQKSS